MTAPAAPMRVFISYSRTDTKFVDDLETDLIARGFKPWVDRRAIEGGDDWLDSIQHAIDSCAKLVLVLTPLAVASDFVRMEYRYARSKGKPIIPLLLKPVTDPPMDLPHIQWITSFQSDQEQGMRDLVIALSRTDAPAMPSSAANLPGTAADAASQGAGATGQDVAEMSARDLYLEGRSAYEAGDIERAAIFWEQLITKAPNYLDGEVKARLAEIMPRLRPARIGRLREEADRARVTGNWDGEIRAWQGVLALDPKDEQAKEELPIAQRNKSSSERYEVVRELYSRGNHVAATRDLEELWRRAPYYGDPAGLAPHLGLVVPPSFRVDKARKAAVKRAQDDADRIAQQAADKAKKDQLDADRLAAAKKRDDEKKEALRQAELEAQEWIEKARRAARPRYRKGNLSAVGFSVWLCALAFLSGIEVVAEQTLRISLFPSVPLQTEALPLAALVAAGLVTYTLGYWRALRWDVFGLALLLAGAVALGTVYVWRSAPGPLTAYSLPFFGKQPIGPSEWLGVALGFGAVWAVVCLVVGSIIGLIGGGEGLAIGAGIGFLCGGLWGLITGASIALFGVLPAGLYMGLIVGIITGLASTIATEDISALMGIVLAVALPICLVTWLFWSIAFGLDVSYTLTWSLAGATGIVAGTGLGLTLHVWFRRRESLQQIVAALKSEAVALPVPGAYPPPPGSYPPPMQ